MAQKIKVTMRRYVLRVTCPTPILTKLLPALATPSLSTAGHCTPVTQTKVFKYSI